MPFWSCHCPSNYEGKGIENALLDTKILCKYLTKVVQGRTDGAKTVFRLGRPLPALRHWTVGEAHLEQSESMQST